MARGLASLVPSAALVATLCSSTATAAPIELVDQRWHYWVFDDVDGSVEAAYWFDRDGFLDGYVQVEDGFLAVHPDDSQFLVVYTTWSLPAGIGAFFQSVANDVHGIGYEHIAPEDAVIPEPYFDDTPNSQVEGFLHLNRWTQYLGDDPSGYDDLTISLIFGQELGHAWGSFVYFSQDGGPGELGLLGRAHAHWSFYMDTGGSPMQGHTWVDNGDGTFTAQKTDLYTFSDLDLYLMGLLPAEDVEPWFIIEDPTDCVDAASGDGVCAPVDAFGFEAPTYTVTGTRRDVSLDDVLAVEGPRMPAWPEAPSEFDVSFMLIKRPDEELSYEQLAAIDGIVERSIEIFEMQTRGLGVVVNRTEGEAPPPPPPDEGTTGEGLDGTAGADSASDSSASGETSGAPSQDDGGSGCGCRSEPAPGRWLDSGLLAWLLLARRRRQPAL